MKKIFLYICITFVFSKNINAKEVIVGAQRTAQYLSSLKNKKVVIQNVSGPVGVVARNHLFERINSLGWRAEVSLRQGIEVLYPWIVQQVERNI